MNIINNITYDEIQNLHKEYKNLNNIDDYKKEYKELLEKKLMNYDHIFKYKKNPELRKNDIDYLRFLNIRIMYIEYQIYKLIKR